MAIADETTLRIVLYEGEGAAALDAGDRGATVTALLEQGYAVTCAGAGAVAPADDSALLVLGRFENGQAPEAEDANGAVTVAFRDITGLDSEGITALVATERASTQSAKHGDWKPWFPVIELFNFPFFHFFQSSFNLSISFVSIPFVIIFIVPPTDGNANLDAPSPRCT